MQKDNDQRTDKDLEVEEYLSQFGADEEVQDDTDISSFLIDDPEESLNAESTPSETELEPEVVDEEPETDAPPSEADDFDFESIDSGRFIRRHCLGCRFGEFRCGSRCSLRQFIDII